MRQHPDQLQDLPWEDPIPENAPIGVITSPMAALDMILPVTRGHFKLLQEGRITTGQFCFLVSAEEANAYGRTIDPARYLDRQMIDQLISLRIICPDDPEGMLQPASRWDWAAIEGQEATHA